MFFTLKINFYEIQIINACYFFCTHIILFAQKKQYDNILNKVEKNIEKNYFTDSIFAVRHSEYIFNELTEDFEKVVCIEYFPTPIWSDDGEYYNRRFRFNNSIFPIRVVGYLIAAKLYKKNESKKLGFTFPHRFASPYSRMDIDDFNSSLYVFVRNNKEKRAKMEELKNNNNDTNLPNKINIPSFNTNDKQWDQEPKISIEYGKVNDRAANNLPKKITMTGTPIYTKVSDTTFYTVENIVYNEIDCYKLTRVFKASFIYKDFERQRFENGTINEPPDLRDQKPMSEQKKEEFRQIIEYWANGESVASVTYIINKKNYAVLSYLRELQQQNNKGEWMEIEKIIEKYQEGKNKKYYQTSFTKLVRNYNGGSPNINNILTLVVRTPSEKSFSLDSVTVIQRKMMSLTYEDLCVKVDNPDDDMLLDWNKYYE